jgi:poly-gamma-glutamate capsule biosynthesis protein CapA/YwtB (metallophosphatase superfamily)
MQRPASHKSSTGISIAIVGDMEVNRDEPEKVFDKVNSELRKANIRFGGLEAPLSVRGTPLTGKIIMRHDPRMIAAYLAGGFEVVAFASNHCLDYGIEPFVDTLDLLDRHQIRYVGAGRNIEEARRPAIIEKNGVRVGFLSYLQLLPLGWWAHPAKPGVAPIREDALYGPPYVNDEDLEAMALDIKRTRSEADIVVSSYHWGQSQSRTLTLSQKAVAHAAIDAGADLVIGRHPHILQGIEVYKGKAIFYAIGNFALDHAHPMFLPTVKESLLIRCDVENKSISRLSFRPVTLGDDGSPEILTGNDARAQTLLEPLCALSKKLRTLLHLAGDEVVVPTGRRTVAKAKPEYRAKAKAPRRKRK